MFHFQFQSDPLLKHQTDPYRHIEHVSMYPRNDLNRTIGICQKDSFQNSSTRCCSV